jgi:hypothetical protein
MDFGSANNMSIFSDLPVKYFPYLLEFDNRVTIVIKTNCIDATILEELDNITIETAGDCSIENCEIFIKSGTLSNPNWLKFYTWIVDVEGCDTIIRNSAENVKTYIWVRLLFIMAVAIFGYKRNSFMEKLFCSLVLFISVMLIFLPVATEGVAQPECKVWAEVLLGFNCSYKQAIYVGIHSPYFNNSWNPFSCPIVVDGRPYVTENGILSAQVKHLETDWITEVTPSLNPLTDPQKSQKWLTTALNEQSSVASFSVFSLQLLAVGAPSDLVKRAHLSAIDEIKHAQLSFGLASSFSGSPISPGEYTPHTISIEPDLLGICSAVAREGCVAETFSTLKAALDLEEEKDPVVREVLQTIIKDETRHSVLAWDTIKWCIERNSTLVEPLYKVILEELYQFSDSVGVELVKALVNIILFKQETYPNFSGKKSIVETAAAEGIYISLNK